MQWIIVFLLLLALSFSILLIKKKSTSRLSTSKKEIFELNPWLVSFASQAGFAEQLANQTADLLKKLGMAVTLKPLHTLTPAQLLEFKHAVFVVSTFGEGEAPDHARNFLKRMQQTGHLKNLRFGMLALGDKHYENFCGFGRALDAWLQKQGAQPLFERIEVDNGDDIAISAWKNKLSAFGEPLQEVEWETPHYERWRLVQRQLLNPDSQGSPVFHLELESAMDTKQSWQAGDLVNIKPRYSPALVEERLVRLQLQGEHCIECQKGSPMTWREILSTHQWSKEFEEKLSLIRTQPEVSVLLKPLLKPLATRQYSISSTPDDGRIHLLIRQTFHNHQLGLGSGWLTEYLGIGEELELMIRSNPSFHLPDGDFPVIFIGNGTGIAGLRSHLKARIQCGYQKNWLFFGERNAKKDFFYQEEIERWHQQGSLKLDCAFSRDHLPKHYVQHRLQAAAQNIREWINDGAFIVICGSLKGMAPAVEEVLVNILGSSAELEKLIAEGRYLRDVY